MKEILIYSGTTEGRKIAGLLRSNGICCTVCVATEYGESVMEKMQGLTIHQGRMTVDGMRQFLKEGEFLAVVDATHPFASAVSENIKESLADTQIPYLRLKRDTSYFSEDREDIFGFMNHEACADVLEKTEGNILLTTGSKDLAVYCKRPALLSRLFVRVLPAMESLAQCYENGMAGKQIIAMQGPFSMNMNEAIIEQYGIDWLVTKESGGNGGFMEKITAARHRGIKTMVIQNPEQTRGASFEEVIEQLEELTGKRLEQENRIQISLVGIGMGNQELMTVEAVRRIKEADMIFGAKRLLMCAPADKMKLPFYQARDILPYLKERGRGKKAVILFSGDTGFYSGAQKLADTIRKEMEEETLMADLFITPGISSISCLAARLGISWQDGVIESMHGRSANILETLRTNRKTFLLLSGPEDLQKLGTLLMEAEMEWVRITAGFQLTYPEERILFLIPRECCEIKEEGLYVCLIENERAEEKYLTHGLPDEEFIRDKVPMTKEEIREISICKLRLHQKAVLYDIGSGTGSVAAEAAGLSPGIQVYAIEKKKDAVCLIEKNRKKFDLNNITVVEGEAQEILECLPCPTHAFIGGSEGKLKVILKQLYQKNPRMRIVMNAVTLETISEITNLLTEIPAEQTDIVQVQVSKAAAVGRYHLMQAQNPVYIISFQFKEADPWKGCKKGGKE